MSAHMKAHHIKEHAKVIVELPNYKKIFYISPENYNKFEPLLEKYSEDDDKPVAWEVLAKERIEKYKKSGIVLRGMRYRENLSQKVLAQKSGVSQNEISKIENGKRTVEEKIARRLAKVLHFDYRMLLED